MFSHLMRLDIYAGDPPATIVLDKEQPECGHPPAGWVVSEDGSRMVEIAVCVHVLNRFPCACLLGKCVKVA